MSLNEKLLDEFLDWDNLLDLDIVHDNFFFDKLDLLVFDLGVRNNFFHFSNDFFPNDLSDHLFNCLNSDFFASDFNNLLDFLNNLNNLFNISFKNNDFLDLSIN